ncbi:hypothetical protein AB0N62_42150 [Streptomyces sp. NPDC093982]|uniref:hypothetical protein n=1 Tax=Streptomyces sp. NPDC093982 TaxID=3155077 RepID=UPI0034157F3B
MSPDVYLSVRTQLEAWRPGAPAGPLLRAAWSVRRSLPVRIAGVDVVRIASSTWPDTHAALREWGIARGPFLVTLPRACVELAVPLGTVATWPALPTTRCVRGAIVRCPAPTICARDGLHVDGRTWLYPPMDAPNVPSTTDADALADAVRTALRRADERRQLHDSREGFRP